VGDVAPLIVFWQSVSLPTVSAELVLRNENENEFGISVRSLGLRSLCLTTHEEPSCSSHKLSCSSDKLSCSSHKLSCSCHKLSCSCDKLSRLQALNDLSQALDERASGGLEREDEELVHV
jgi:hypothetical protein